MRLFWAALDTGLDSPFFLPASQFTVCTSRFTCPRAKDGESEEQHSSATSLTFTRVPAKVPRGPVKVPSVCGWSLESAQGFGALRISGKERLFQEVAREVCIFTKILASEHFVSLVIILCQILFLTSDLESQVEREGRPTSPENKRVAEEEHRHHFQCLQVIEGVELGPGP